MSVPNYFSSKRTDEIQESHLLWAEWLVSSGEDSHKKPPLELSPEDKKEWWEKLAQNARAPKISEVTLFSQVLSFPVDFVRKSMRIYCNSDKGNLVEFLDYLGIAFEREKRKPTEDIVL